MARPCRGGSRRRVRTGCWLNRTALSDQRQLAFLWSCHRSRFAPFCCRSHSIRFERASIACGLRQNGLGQSVEDVMSADVTSVTLVLCLCAASIWSRHLMLFLIVVPGVKGDGQTRSISRVRATRSGATSARRFCSSRNCSAMAGLVGTSTIRMVRRIGGNLL